MRRTIIQTFLPVCFCLLPILAALVVAACIPRDAMLFFIEKIGPMDILILSLGSSLFSLQMLLLWRAMRWQGTKFDERNDKWISNLAQAAEWFPMLGLIGTVAGILQTFSAITGPVPPSVIIQKYAPAITATGAGLFMAFINILPPWVILLGRDLILTLTGDVPVPPEGETR